MWFQSGRGLILGGVASDRRQSLIGGARRGRGFISRMGEEDKGEGGCGRGREGGVTGSGRDRKWAWPEVTRASISVTLMALSSKPAASEGELRALLERAHGAMVSRPIATHCAP